MIDKGGIIVRVAAIDTNFRSVAVRFQGCCSASARSYSFRSIRCICNLPRVEKFSIRGIVVTHIILLVLAALTLPVAISQLVVGRLLSNFCKDLRRRVA